MSTQKKSIYFFGAQVISLGALSFAIVGSTATRQAFTSADKAEAAFSAFKKQASIYVLNKHDTVARLHKTGDHTFGVADSVELSSEQIKSLQDSVKTRGYL